MLTHDFKTISYLKKHAAQLLNEAAETRRPITITRHGKPALVVMNVQAYREECETLALLKMLALGQREIAEGQYRSVEEVFAAIDQEN